MLDDIPEIQAVLRDPFSAARASGRAIALFMSNNVPVELIHAAGYFPLQWPTSPLPATPLADRYMEARFDPMSRVALEQLLRGELDDVALLVLPRTIDSLQRLYYYLCELRRGFRARIPEPLLYDLLHTPFQSSAHHNLQITRALAARFEGLTKTPIDASRLTTSIAQYDRIRAKLQHLMQRRRSEPCELTGRDALALYTASQRLLPEVFEPILDRLLASPPKAAPGVRVFLAGSAHDSPVLYERIANVGGQVVADFHWRGDLLWGPPVAAAHGGDALAALSQHYHRATLSCRTFPMPLEALLSRAQASRAEAAIFFYYEEEDALTWDFPQQSQALRTLGIEALALEHQPYPPTAAVEPAIAEFLSRAASSRRS